MLSRGAFVAGSAALGVFLNSLDGELIFDDVHAVIRNQVRCLVASLCSLLDLKSSASLPNILITRRQDVLGGRPLSEIFANDFWYRECRDDVAQKYAAWSLYI